MQRLFWPAVSTVAMLALTLSLGIWQLQRLAWKQGLLAEIDRGEQSAAVPLSDNPPAFGRVLVQGRFLPLVARYGAEVRSTRAGAAMGAHLLSPMERADGPPVIVDRGWAPLDFDPTLPSGPLAIEGYVRPPEPPVRFGATDDPVARRFFSLDPAAIGAALGLTQVMPFTVVMLGPPGTFPEPAGVLPRPSNDHLFYAITWFSLALVLVVIFAVYVRQTLAAKKA